MDKEEAAELLVEELKKYRIKSYTDLTKLIGEIAAYEVHAPDGAEYQIEIEVRWDAKPDGDIRVLGGIDDVDAAGCDLREEFLDPFGSHGR